VALHKRRHQEATAATEATSYPGPRLEVNRRPGLARLGAARPPLEHVEHGQGLKCSGAGQRVEARL